MKKPTLYLAGGYALALILFFFLGMSKPKFPSTLIVFVVVTAFYLFAVWFVKKFIATK